MRVLPVLVAAFLLGGCANTQLKTYPGPAFTDTYRIGRVLVIAKMPPDEREAVESSIVGQFRSVGVDAVRSLDAMPDVTSRIDWQAIGPGQEEARRIGADSVLLLGGLYADSSFGTAYMPLSSPGGTTLIPTIAEHRKKRFAARLYDLSGNPAVWTANGESMDNWTVSSSIFGAYVAEAVVSQLTKEGLLGKRS